MNRFKHIMLGLRSQWGRAWVWLRRKAGKEPVYKVVWIDEEPDQPAAGVIYVIKDAGITWGAAMACPGGCGQVLHMNLIPDSKPVWQLTEELDGAASLHPSVWRQEGCGCHFVLRRGRIEWCG